MVFKGYLFSVLYAVACLLLSFILYKIGMQKKYTRKVVHILVGFEWIILGYFHGNAFTKGSLHILNVCVLFFILLLIVYKKHLMPMISSDGDNSPGTVYYCVSMSIMAAVSLFEPRFMLPFGIAVFCTSLGDGFAGVLGQAIRKFNPRIWKSKTLIGSLFGLVFSFLSSFVLIRIFAPESSLWISVLIAVFSTELEIVTGFGLDNISLPIGASTLSYFLLYYSTETLNYIVPILLTPFMLAVVIERRVLTRVGTVAAIILDFIVSLAFGNMGFIMMALFLVGGVAIDKVKEKIKGKSLLSDTKSDSTRDAYQVLANSLPAMLLSLAYVITSHEVFLVAFAVSVAEAFSDTCASGLGVLSSKTYDVFKLRRAEQGMSGGMSLVGTLSSLLGAALVSIIPLCFGIYGFYHALFVTLCAFFGAVFDSFLGSVFQVKYRCLKCGKLTERAEHCGRSAKKVAGFSSVDNDVVNFASGVFCSVLALLLYFAFFS